MPAAKVLAAGSSGSDHANAAVVYKTYLNRGSYVLPIDWPITTILPLDDKNVLNLGAKSRQTKTPFTVYRRNRGRLLTTNTHDKHVLVSEL